MLGEPGGVARRKCENMGDEILKTSIFGAENQLTAARGMVDRGRGDKDIEDEEMTDGEWEGEKEPA